MARGLLIVFEGAEGAGKSTQLKLLADALGSHGRNVVAVREPGGTVLGDEIRRLLLDPAMQLDIVPRAEALLFMASRAQLVEREIRPALGDGAIVLLDRFFLSTYAYQGDGRGLEERDLRSANLVATGGLVPDIVLLLRLPVAEGLSRAARRGEHDRIEQAELAFHQRVALAFERFATDEWQQAHPECGPIVVVDGAGSEVEVYERVWAELHARWPGTFPIGQRVG
jgi:dTMP kinase